MKPIELYPNGAPDYVADYGQPLPVLTPFFLPGPDKKPCVIVCPGGGYVGRCESYEGVEICEWLNANGFSAAMLSYRVAPYRAPVPQNDLDAALRYVRANADSLFVDAHKIGVMGFSAGAHLCASVLTHTERFERPDFGILCYGVLSLHDDITHVGSRVSLLGEDASETDVAYWSPDDNVSHDTPPCFLFHTRADSCVPCENSLRFAQKLTQAGVAHHLCLTEAGEHGVGLAHGIPGTEKWPDECVAFLKTL